MASLELTLWLALLFRLTGVRLGYGKQLAWFLHAIKFRLSLFLGTQSARVG